MVVTNEADCLNLIDLEGKSLGTFRAYVVSQEEFFYVMFCTYLEIRMVASEHPEWPAERI